MNDEEKLEVATQVDRMTAAPVLYDCLALSYAAAVPASGVQAITLASTDYELFTDGAEETSSTSGMSITRDGFFTNLFKNGGMDKSLDVEIYGIGFAFTGTPFIATAGIASGSQIVGTMIDAATHAESLANLFLSQCFVEVGAEEEECVALAGPVGLWGYGGYGLGDNSVSPRLLNALVGNQRNFRMAFLNKPVRRDGGGGNMTVRVRRSEKIALTYSTGSVVSAGATTVAMLVHCFAYGRRVFPAAG